MGKQPRAHVEVTLPNGSALFCTVTFDFVSQKHHQSTSVGLRSVKRIEADEVGPAGVTIPLYRTPDDSTIDGLRCRLHSQEGGLDLEQIGTVDVAESVFMAEACLGV